MAALAILWAVRWYCSKQHLKLQQDNLSYGNVMKRSRHSIHLSSTHAGESVGQVGGGAEMWRGRGQNLSILYIGKCIIVDPSAYVFNISNCSCIKNSQE